MIDYAETGDLWWQRAGVEYVCSWHEHARQPYANELLLALMRRFSDVMFVVGFDGFIPNPSEDQLRTLTLYASPVRSSDRAYLQSNIERARAYMDAWVHGWRAAQKASAAVDAMQSVAAAEVAS